MSPKGTQLTKNYYSVVSKRPDQDTETDLTALHLSVSAGWRYGRCEFPLQVVQDILEHEREFVKELQTVLSCYLRPLLASDK